MKEGQESGSGGVWEKIRETVENLDCNMDFDWTVGEKGRSKVKVVCIAPDLKESFAEMGKQPRDRVVMVRLDKETDQRLDDWVETGAVSSRSEAAALFIREGLKVRESELQQLDDELKNVADAKQRLRKRAATVFGEDEPEGEEASSDVTPGK